MPMPTTKKGLQTSANYFLLAGFLSAIVARIMIYSEPSLPVLLLGILLALGSTVVWVMGCMRYVMSKGYSPWMGFLGLLSCLGLIILAVLPDKWNDAAPPSPTNYPRYPQG